MAESWIIGFKKAALSDLQKLDRGVAERILDKLLWIARNVNSISHDALTGNWSGAFRFRVGDYRVIYTLDVDHSLLVVIAIGHRRDIYVD